MGIGDRRRDSSLARLGRGGCWWLIIAMIPLTLLNCACVGLEVAFEHNSLIYVRTLGGSLVTVIVVQRLRKDHGQRDGFIVTAMLAGMSRDS